MSVESAVVPQDVLQPVPAAPVQNDIVEYEVKLNVRIDPNDPKNIIIIYPSSGIKKNGDFINIGDDFAIINKYFPDYTRYDVYRLELGTPNSTLNMSGKTSYEINVIVHYSRATKTSTKIIAKKAELALEPPQPLIDAISAFLSNNDDSGNFIYNTKSPEGLEKGIESIKKLITNYYLPRLEETATAPAPAQAAGGLHKIRKLDEKVVVGGRERVVYKAGNKKFVKVKGDYVSLTEFRKATEAAAKLKQKAAKK